MNSPLKLKSVAHSSEEQESTAKVRLPAGPPDSWDRTCLKQLCFFSEIFITQKKFNGIQILWKNDEKISEIPMPFGTADVISEFEMCQNGNLLLFPKRKPQSMVVSQKKTQRILETTQIHSSYIFCCNPNMLRTMNKRLKGRPVPFCEC